MTQRIELVSPRHSGYRRQFDSLSEVRERVAHLLDCAVADIIEIDVPEGSETVTYCYASQAEADSDRDGAYAVHYYQV